MKSYPDDHSVLSFSLNAKLHENLKIRLFYDEIKTQSEFFRYCVESYLGQNPLFMEFLDDYKINKKVQSKKRVGRSRKLRGEGEKILRDLALTDEDVENIFDILEEELPEL
ncbi:hypothetical protein CMI37_23585 [Candidatus Pacearchaeota archaeon]|nr:hypothetical protein [Candidatus Pacearchaeota archaeon]|tara:strand:+ start:14906 stop:15238 length:333 start_codon:yes stop_codon:yes gene_type:complete